MVFEILTIFPAMFEGVFSESIIKRACEKGIVSLRLVDFRDFTDDKHKTVDDYQYGGGPGMLIKPEPLARAIKASKERLTGKAPKTIYLSPQGELLTHETAQKLSNEQAIILLCGHYQGIDQRIVDHYVDQEISIGDYVVSGGEIPAMALVDSIVRLIPGVLGNAESAPGDSLASGLLSPPQYTRPEIFEGEKVPEVLISGHHENIRKWQEEQSIASTRRKRPDLWEKYRKKINVNLSGRRPDAPPKSPAGGLVGVPLAGEP
jgi:tRNA (guanine37-N1)-methyltransferase